MTDEDSHDHPLNCHWRPVRPDAYDRLGLPPTRSEAAALARGQILTEAFVVGRSDPCAWVSYSRRREFYTARRGRYWPPTYTFDFVVPAIDQLAGLGLLDHEKTPQGGRGWQSRFKASAELMELLNQASIEVVFDPLEPIRLRDHRRSLIEYNETDQTRRWRRNIEKINGAVQSTPIALRNQIIRDGGALPLVSNFRAVSSQLHRVFNRCSFGLGGRLYGPWWQNIPSESRSFISIDGVETVELDYPHLHPMLLYLEAGQRMHGEPYDLLGWPRKLVKVAFNTLVNADTRHAALRAIANEIGGEGAYAMARTLVEEIEARHQSIAQMFGTSAGLRLQRIDSDITEGIMLRLARKTVVALPIHDSYIVRGLCFEKGELMEAMGEGLWRVERNSTVRSVGYRKSIPQYGGGGGKGGGGGGGGGGSGKGGGGSLTSGSLSSKMDQAQEMSTGDLSSGPAARIVIVFPEERQRDLFGGDRLNVPYREILGWRGGIALPGVQKALRREMRRRGLRHLDLADRVGVSRSHLENIMDGRRGASSLVASRLRDFLVDGAKTVGMAA